MAGAMVEQQWQTRLHTVGSNQACLGKALELLDISRDRHSLTALYFFSVDGHFTLTDNMS